MIEDCERRHDGGEDLPRHLKHWLSEHIPVEDKASAKVLAERGRIDAALAETARHGSF